MSAENPRYWVDCARGADCCARTPDARCGYKPAGSPRRHNGPDAIEAALEAGWWVRDTSRAALEWLCPTCGTTKASGR